VNLLILESEARVYAVVCQVSMLMSPARGMMTSVL
jgi:hypothetical protein